MLNANKNQLRLSSIKLLIFIFFYLIFPASHADCPQADMALHEAQEVPRGSTTPTESRNSIACVPGPDALYAHPSYWAPFVLMGNC